MERVSAPSVEYMLDHMSSHELTEWMALLTVEAEEEQARREDPEGAKEEADKRRAEFYRPPPGILVRINEDEPDEVAEDIEDVNG